MRWLLSQEAESSQDEGLGGDASRPGSDISASPVAVPLPKGPAISQTVPAAGKKAFKHVYHRRGHFMFKSQPISKHTPPSHN